VPHECAAQSGNPVVPHECAAQSGNPVVPHECAAQSGNPVVPHECAAAKQGVGRMITGRKGRSKLALLAVVVASGLLVAAIVGFFSPSPGKGKRVVVFSPHWEGITKEFGWGFTEWMKKKHGTEARIEVLDVGGGTGDILRYIESSYRKSPDGIGVDVIFGGGVPAHASLAEKGFLERAALPVLVQSNLAQSIGGMPLHDPVGRWFGAAMSGFGIVSNRRIVERMELPGAADWSRLAHPRLFGWVASGDPTSSGSVLACFEVILQAYGFERGYSLITRIAGNVGAFDVRGNAAARSVGLGQSAYGLSIDIYAYEQVARAGSENIGFVMPRRFTVITPDPIAILKGAPNRELARRFVEYVLSRDGQKLWYVKAGHPGGPRKYGLNRLPVIRNLYGSDLPTAVTVNPFEWGGGFQFDQTLARKRSRVFSGLARATILECHSELREAWAAVIAAGVVDHPELVRELGKAPVTDEELVALSRRWSVDAAFRQKTTAEWSRFAREKLERVREKALRTAEGNRR
jgi:ABC-type Fe3+ transport system substrate-binding protein